MLNAIKGGPAESADGEFYEAMDCMHTRPQKQSQSQRRRTMLNSRLIAEALKGGKAKTNPTLTFSCLLCVFA